MPRAKECEALVSEIENYRRPNSRNRALHARVIQWPGKQSAPAPQIYCAYNQTRQQFLCAHVLVNDLSPEDLNNSLAKLTQDSSTGLWLAPFRGISANQVGSPIDLVFLDQNNCVLTVVESFPISQPTNSNWQSGSALALPTHSIASSGTLVGDQVVLCSPEKMLRRLRDLRDKAAAILENTIPSTHPHSVSPQFPDRRKTSVQMTNWADIRNHSHQPLQTPAPAAAPEPMAELSAPTSDLPIPSRSWLYCWLTPKKQEMRESPRENLPWIAAYFFNGGSPAPTAIRNISMHGMFIVTSERWYLGTIIHVTLTDWRLPTPDHTITVNAVAVRWSDDGVGLRFIFQKPRRGAPTPGDSPLVDVTQKQLKEFLEQFKGPKR
jgi:hypothetical protein